MGQSLWKHQLGVRAGGWGLGGLVRALQATSCCCPGLAAWEEYPTLKMLMEMVMTK